MPAKSQFQFDSDIGQYCSIKFFFYIVEECGTKGVNYISSQNPWNPIPIPIPESELHIFAPSWQIWAQSNLNLWQTFSRRVHVGLLSNTVLFRILLVGQEDGKIELQSAASHNWCTFHRREGPTRCRPWYHNNAPGDKLESNLRRLEFSAAREKIDCVGGRSPIRLLPMLMGWHRKTSDGLL